MGHVHLEWATFTHLFFCLSTATVDDTYAVVGLRALDAAWSWQLQGGGRGDRPSCPHVTVERTRLRPGQQPVKYNPTSGEIPSQYPAKRHPISYEIPPNIHILTLAMHARASSRAAFAALVGGCVLSTGWVFCAVL
jgi:hypothetical protein